jgi:hypothetical protein
MCQTPITTKPTGIDPPGRSGNEETLKFTAARTKQDGPLEPIKTEQRNLVLEALAKLNRNQRGARPAGTPPIGLKAFDKDQDGPSCVGYAVAKLVEACFLGYGPESSQGELDPEFLWNVANATDQTPQSLRTNLLEALRVARDIGAPLLGQAGTYDAKALEKSPGLLEKAKSHRIRHVVEMSGWIEEWIDWLQVEGPIAVQLNINPAVFESLAPDSSTDTTSQATYPWVTYNPAAKADSHAVLVVSYSESPEPHFLFLNSEGPKWGKDGYARISLTTATQCFFRGYGAIVRNQLHRKAR